MLNCLADSFFVRVQPIGLDLLHKAIEPFYFSASCCSLLTVCVLLPPPPPQSHPSLALISFTLKIWGLFIVQYDFIYQSKKGKGFLFTT